MLPPIYLKYQIRNQKKEVRDCCKDAMLCVSNIKRHSEIRNPSFPTQD